MDDKTKAVRERLERIRRREKGILTPDAVVNDARDTSSPLHGYFTWDDTEAAKQFRLDQARTLIRNIKVEVITTTNRVAAPFYVRDPQRSSDEQGYRAIAEIKDERSASADALQYEFNRAIAVLERAVSIAEELGMSTRVAELIQRIRLMQSTIPMAESQSKSQAKTPSVAARKT
jgi:hypothetical protein